VSWHPRVEGLLLDDPTDPGFWAVVRHADIQHVSRHNDVFVSGRRVMFENAPQELLLSRLPDIEAGEPDPLDGCFAHAVRSIPCTFTA
jgi:cytochrome P450